MGGIMAVEGQKQIKDTVEVVNVTDMYEKMMDVFNSEGQVSVLCKSFQGMGGELASAPLTMKLLFDMCLESTKQDFLIGVFEIDESTNLKGQQSFRACLSDVLFAANKALKVADNAMERISLWTDRVPNLMKRAVKLMDTERELSIFLPRTLEKIKEIADQCKEESKSVKNEYQYVINLLQQLHKTVLTKQCTVQEAKKLAIDQIEAEKNLQSHLETILIDQQEQLEKARKEYKTFQNLFLKSLEEQSLFLASYQKASEYMGNFYSICGKVCSRIKETFTRKKLSDNGNLNIECKEKLKDLLQSESKIDINDLICHQDDLEVLQCTYQRLNSLLDIDSVSKYGFLDNYEKSLIYVKECINSINSNISSSSKSDDLKRKVLSIVEKTLEWIGILEKAGKHIDMESFKEVSIAVKEYSLKISDLEKCVSQLIKSSQNIKSIQKMKEKIKITKEAMEDSKEQERKVQKVKTQIQNDINKTCTQLEELTRENNQQNNVEEVIKTSLLAFRNLQESWESQGLFFTSMSNHIDILMHQDTNEFLELIESGKNSEMLFCGKEIILKSAFQAVKRASVVNHISTLYCQVSRKYLMPLNASIHTALCQNGEIGDNEKEKINRKCQDVSEDIKEFVLKTHDDYLQKVRKNMDGMMKENGISSNIL